MEVILKTDVDGTGLRGEVVNVARGFARNYLLPRGLAEVATPALVTGSLFGSVTATNVADRLWEQEKIRIDRRKLEMQTIKRIGRYTVPVDVFQDVTAELRLAVAPEGQELPAEEELAALEAAEAEATAVAEAEAAAEHAEAEAAVEAEAAAVEAEDADAEAVADDAAEPAAEPEPEPEA